MQTQNESLTNQSFLPDILQPTIQQLTDNNLTLTSQGTKVTGDYLRARKLLQLWGKTSTSYMTLQLGNQLFIEQSGRAYLAYRRHLGVAITVGDPIGEPEAIEECIRQFRNFCVQKGWIPVFFAIENNLPIYQELKLSKFQVAEDAYLNLVGLRFSGKHWQDVRTACNRAKREQLEFHRFEAGFGLSSYEGFQQFVEISDKWLKAKKLPELGFMLGTTATINDPAVRTYYATDRQGRVQGFVSWLPCYYSQGWALDLMRRRQGAMPGIMEFLIASSALCFQAEGFTNLALGAAPLAPVQNQRILSLKEQLLGKLKFPLDHFYGFSNLYNFKRKFQPEWRPLYLYYPAGFGLPRIILALLLSYLYRPRSRNKDCNPG